VFLRIDYPQNVNDFYGTKPHNKFIMNLSKIFGFPQVVPNAHKSHVKNLIELAMADGHFADVEKDLLKTIAKKNKISERQLEEIKADLAAIVLAVPTDRHERFYQLYDLVYMMGADKVIHIEEMKMCRSMAEKFGYARGRSQAIIDAIWANIQNGNGHNETYRRIEILLVSE
jgi:uncharacterized tellurite resistance protein B-like protein